MADDVQKIWSAMGLNPQAFPFYYGLGLQQFTLDGTPSGAVGAAAVFSRDLSNFPHMLVGIRITNHYALPAVPTADDYAAFRALHEWVDGEQTVRIDLAQQNILSERVLTSHVTGHDGINWHPFPTPFPMAGANNIAVEVRRVTPYPAAYPSEAALVPQCSVTLVSAVLRADLQTSAVHRVHP